MGKHTTERTAELRRETHAVPRRTILVLALVVTGTLVAWGVLVFAAIDFGREARSGEPAAWAFLVLSTLGAAACLFVTLLLGARILTMLQGREPVEPRPARPQGGRRAAR